MKKSFVVLGLIVFVLFNCSRGATSEDDHQNAQPKLTVPATKVNLDVKAGVSMELMHGLPGTLSDPPPALHVHILVTNHSTPISYDLIHAEFIPLQGPSLKMETRPDSQSGKMTFNLETGQQEDYMYTTDGYTERLMAGSYGEPLKFSIMFLASNKIIAGPYLGILPSLDTPMPVYEMVLMGDKPLPFPLNLQK